MAGLLSMVVVVVLGGDGRRREDRGVHRIASHRHLGSNGQVMPLANRAKKPGAAAPTRRTDGQDRTRQDKAG